MATVVSAIKSKVSSGVSALKSTVSSGVSTVKSTVSSGVSTVKSTVSSGVSTAKSTVSSGVSGGISTAKSVASTVKAGGNSSSGSNSSVSKTSSPGGGNISVGGQGQGQGSSVLISNVDTNALKSGKFTLVAGTTPTQTQTIQAGQGGGSTMSPVTAYNKIMLGETPTHADYIAATGITNPNIVNTKNPRLQDKVKNIALTAPNYNAFVAPNSFMGADGKVHVIAKGANVNTTGMKKMKQSASADIIGLNSGFRNYYNQAVSSPAEAERLVGADYRRLNPVEKTETINAPQEITPVEQKGWYGSKKDQLNKAIGAYWVPADPTKQEAWAKENDNFVTRSWTKSQAQLQTNLPDMEEKRKQNMAEFSKIIPGYKTYYESDFHKQAEKRGEVVENFSIGLFEEIREHPVDIAEMVALSYVGGAALGRAGSVASKAISKIPASAGGGYIAGAGSFAGKAIGVGGDVSFVKMADLYGQGKTISMQDLAHGRITSIPIEDGVTYERWSPEWSRRVGSYTASDLIPGEIGMRKGFRDTFKSPVDLSKLKTRRELDVSKVMSDIRDYNPGVTKKYGADNLRKIDGDLRKARGDLMDLKTSKKPTKSKQAEIKSLEAKREKLLNIIEKKVIDDNTLSIAKELRGSRTTRSVRNVEKSIQKQNDFKSFQQKTMEIYGGDINKPELKGGRNVSKDELFIGNKRGDELFIGNRQGNITRVFGGANDFFGAVSEIRVPRVKDFAVPTRFRKPTKDATGYERGYNYSSDSEFDNIARNLIDDANAVKNATARRFKDETGYKFKDEPGYKFQDETGYKLKDEMAYGFEHKFAHPFDFESEVIRLPNVNPSPVNLPNFKKGKTTKRKSSGGLELDRHEYHIKNPFARIEEFANERSKRKKQ